ncbi:MAG: maleylpyruvate isomerase family mycothiol-dependent enzyme [Acidimicrobiia bacterium]|nr:maleylpyruvate isomerase family mycothiol-dependent enzyme [Acidimicrobiia bacterium]
MEIAPRYEGPPIIAIAGEPDDQLVPLVRQRRRMEAILVDLDDGDWGSASRCDGWTVHDVVAHVVGVNDFWRASVRAGVAGTPTRILAGFDPAATPPLMVASMRDLAPGDLLEKFVVSNDGFLEAVGDLDDAAWGLLGESPAGHVPLRLVAHHALWDCWIHERDIALPLGSTPPAEPDEVASCLRYAAALSPALAVASGGTISGVFGVDASDPELRLVLEVGESVSVRDDSGPPEAPSLRGDAVELVEALSLRAPLPASAPAEWRGLLDGLAAAFDVESRPV